MARDRLGVELAELGQEGEQRGDGDRSDAGDRGQPAGAGAAVGQGCDRLGDQPLHAGELALEPDQMLVERAAQLPFGAAPTALLLGLEQLRQLPAAQDQIGQPQLSG
ncbi:MAG: hypothetical protein AB7I59_12480 [Geminicoccaceae bacterium]